MKIFKTKKYSILSNILKFSFMGVLAVVLVFPVLFVNNSVQNTEAAYAGIKVIEETSSYVELQAFNLNENIIYKIDIGNIVGPFKSEDSVIVAPEDFGPGGTYNWKVNHPSSYPPGTEYQAKLTGWSPPDPLGPSVYILIPKNTTGPGTTTGDDGPGTTTGDDDTTGTTLNTKINNPLGDNIDDIPSFIEAIVNIVLIVGIPIVALAIIYTGFLFVTAQGSPEKITKAKKALVYTLIGAALLLGAFVIAQAIGKTVEDIKSTT